MREGECYHVLLDEAGKKLLLAATRVWLESASARHRDRPEMVRLQERLAEAELVEVVAPPARKRAKAS